MSASPVDIGSIVSSLEPIYERCVKALSNLSSTLCSASITLSMSSRSSALVAKCSRVGSTGCLCVLPLMTGLLKKYPVPTTQSQKGVIISIVSTVSIRDFIAFRNPSRTES